MSRISLRTVQRLLPGAAVACALVGALASHSCSSTPLQNTGGDFDAPTGITSTTAIDRDLLVVANAGSSDLRVLNICNTPLDGGLTTSCDPNSDLHFIPGPIRVFPASFIGVGNRPLRLAGLKLLAPGFDGGNGTANSPALDAGVALADGGVVAPIGGAVLVAGADPSIYIVDANTLISGEIGPATTLPAPANIPLPGAGSILADGGAGLGAIASDIVAEDQPGVVVRAYAVTIPDVGSGPAQLVALSGALGPTGAIVQIDARCTIDYHPGRLALVPAHTDKLYVADDTQGGVAGGLGDGALEYATADILALGNPATASPCPAGRRLPATNNYATPPRPRPLTSIALNPEVITDDQSSTLYGLNDAGIALCSDGGTPPVPGTDVCGSYVTYPAGAMLLGVTDSSGVTPDPTSPTAGKEAGKLIFLRVADGTVSNRPPYGFFDTTTVDGGPVPPMEPIQPANAAALNPLTASPAFDNPLAREVSFLVPPPTAQCPTDHPDRPCQAVVWAAEDHFPVLAAVATATDGAAYFIEADQRRFFNDQRVEGTPGIIGPLPLISGGPNLSLATQPNAVATTFNLTNGDLDGAGDILREQGLLTPGVTRTADWNVVFHGQIPGLEKRGATMSVASSNPDGSPLTWALEVQGVDFSQYTALTSGCDNPGHYCLGLSVCDVVSFDTFSQPLSFPICQDLQNENSLLGEREMSILAISGNTLTIGPNSASGGVCTDPDPAQSLTQLLLPPFAPAADCFPVGVTAEMRTGNGVAAGKRPWLVFEGGEVRGRTKVNETFNGYESRSDYPLDAPQTLNSAGNPVVDPTENDAAAYGTDDVGFSFVLGCPDPTPGATCDPAPKAAWFIAMSSNQAPVHVFDTGVVPGFAGPVFVYNSPKISNYVYAGITGGNSVLQIDPSLIGVINGVLAYR